MNKRELRTLRGQLLLMAGLFAGSVVLAIVIASQRTFFEDHIKETYRGQAAGAASVARQAMAGEINREDYEKLSAGEKLSLYDFWMVHDEPRPTEMPHALVATDPDLFIARAERTLICGQPDQKRLALSFLEHARSQVPLPVLWRVHRWAVKQQRTQLANDVAFTIERIQVY